METFYGSHVRSTRVCFSERCSDPCHFQKIAYEYQVRGRLDSKYLGNRPVAHVCGKYELKIPLAQGRIYREFKAT